MRNSCYMLVGPCLLFSFLLVGCGDGGEIETYPVPTASVGGVNDPPVPVAGHGGGAVHSPDTPTYPARMLVAMVEDGPQTWFFKLLGPEEAVAAHQQEFDEFVSNLTFADNKPKWTTPDGWDPQGPQGAASLRLETFHVGDHDPDLELTVIMLGTMEGGGDPAILENLNRWRGQLRLQNLGMAQLDENIKRVKLQSGEEAVVMDIKGNAPTNRPGKPPVTGGPLVDSGTGATVPGPPTGRNERSSGPISYATPEGWTSSGSSGLRVASFKISDGNQSAEVTVIPLTQSGTLANVNRWRGQVGLGDVTEAEMQKDLITVTVDGIESPLADIAGEQQTILAAIVNRDGKSWFFKLQGDTALAAREKKNFETFVKSVKFK